jgi:hypothetical protein
MLAQSDLILTSTVSHHGTFLALSRLLSITACGVVEGADRTLLSLSDSVFKRTTARNLSTHVYTRTCFFGLVRRTLQTSVPLYLINIL